MTRLAITKLNDHTIYEITLDSIIPPQGIYERTRVDNGSMGCPFAVAYVSSDLIYYVWDKGCRIIYRTRVEATPAEDEPYYTHPHWIRDLQVRRIAGQQRLYFSAYEQEDAVGLYYLNDDRQAVKLRTIHSSELPVPDPCNPGCEMAWGSWGGYFAFDNDSSLYLSSGVYEPAGIYRISGVTPENIDGPPVRIYTREHGICHLTSANGSHLYFASRAELYRFTLADSQEDIVADTSTISEANVTGISVMPLEFSENWWKWIRDLLKTIRHILVPLLK